MLTSLLSRIQHYNRGRDRQTLVRKYKKMQTTPFAFLRGTCHLFYEDWLSVATGRGKVLPDASLNQAPITWLCGDLHLENFGSYKGDNRQVYFDINDFDEGILAPCTWDMARLLTSIFVAADTLKITRSQAYSLSHRCLDRYGRELKTGRARQVESETSTGMIQDLLAELKQRKRTDFLNKRTEMNQGQRRLKIDQEKVLPVTRGDRAQVEAAMAALSERLAGQDPWLTDLPTLLPGTLPAPLVDRWRETAEFQAASPFFTVLDVAERVAGISSLGLKRYLVLVEGQGSPDRNYLLDLKQARPSALEPYLQTPYLQVAQPPWADAATRSVAIEMRLQSIPAALLHPLRLGEQSFVLRELQPSQDKLSLEDWNGKLQRLETVVETMGAISAWGQLRSSGRDGSAIADELIGFANHSDWQQPLLDYAQRYAHQVERDYAEFCQVAPLDL